MNHHRQTVRWLVAILLLAALAAMVFQVSVASDPAPYPDARYCGTPQRDANGTIIRSAAEVAAFKRIHPCPATGRTTGGCPGWQVDHVVPLACGGCDHVTNMQWLPIEAKTCAEPWCKDRYERRIYGIGIPGTASCPVPKPLGV